MLATMAESVEAFMEAGPGAVLRVTGRYGFPEIGLLVRCPGCGAEKYLPTRGDDHFWRVLIEDPITITPDVTCPKAAGGCGWAGWLQRAEWQEY